MSNKRIANYIVIQYLIFIVVILEFIGSGFEITNKILTIIVGLIYVILTAFYIKAIRDSLIFLKIISVIIFFVFNLNITNNMFIVFPSFLSLLFVTKSLNSNYKKISIILALIIILHYAAAMFCFKVDSNITLSKNNQQNLYQVVCIQYEDSFVAPHTEIELKRLYAGLFSKYVRTLYIMKKTKRVNLQWKNNKIISINGKCFDILKSPTINDLK